VKAKKDETAARVQEQAARTRELVQERSAKAQELVAEKAPAIDKAVREQPRMVAGIAAAVVVLVLWRVRSRRRRSAA
jgi:ElaB/YqjD/DUF883 family membrane-anchored ribosome-binding protein